MLTLNTTPAVCAESVVSITHALIWRPITVGFWNFTRTWTSNYVELQQVLEFGNIWLKSACSELAKKILLTAFLHSILFFSLSKQTHVFWTHVEFFPEFSSTNSEQSKFERQDVSNRKSKSLWTNFSRKITRNKGTFVHIFEKKKKVIVYDKLTKKN
jgi:hypothetical protein